jgi:hypothetical protein
MKKRGPGSPRGRVLAPAYSRPAVRIRQISARRAIAALHTLRIEEEDWTHRFLTTALTDAAEPS